MFGYPFSSYMNVLGSPLLSLSQDGVKFRSMKCKFAHKQITNLLKVEATGEMITIVEKLLFAVDFCPGKDTFSLVSSGCWDLVKIVLQCSMHLQSGRSD